MMKILDAVKTFFQKVSNYVVSAKGQKVLDDALLMAEHSGPAIELAGELVSKMLLPGNPAPELLLGSLVQKYPNFFNGKLNYSTDEMKAQAFILASDFLEQHYGVSTSAARSAIQAMYAAAKR